MTVSTRAPFMANLVLSWNPHCWAEILQPFIIWKLVEQLFQPYTTKSQLFHHYLQNQVSFRLSLFAKPWYASYRSLCHDHFKLWITENGWVCWKLCWLEIWCWNVFLHDAYCVARFNEDDCWIWIVWCLMVLMACLLSISGTNNFSRFVEQDECYCSFTNPK